MTTKIETRILSNGNPVSSDQHLLLNKLAGDDAASGFGVALYTFDNPLSLMLFRGTETLVARTLPRRKSLMPLIVFTYILSPTVRR